VRSNAADGFSIQGNFLAGDGSGSGHRLGDGSVPPLSDQTGIRNFQLQPTIWAIRSLCANPDTPLVWPGLVGPIQERLQPVDLDIISNCWLILGVGSICLAMDTLASYQERDCLHPSGPLGDGEVHGNVHRRFGVAQSGAAIQVQVGRLNTGALPLQARAFQLDDSLLHGGDLYHDTIGRLLLDSWSYFLIRRSHAHNESTGPIIRHLIRDAIDPHRQGSRRKNTATASACHAL